MDDRSPPPQAEEPSGGAPRSRVLWPLTALAIVAVVGAGAGAYFGLRGAAGPGSGPGVSPPARAFAAAAYDEASHQVVVFGGVGAEGSALSDTWTWDGSTWTQRHPAISPPARAFAAMTYDPNAHDVVLVGGRPVHDSPPAVCSGSIAAGGPNATPGVAHPSPPCAANAPTAYADTWVWDGSTWRLAGQAPTPVVGQSPALGTDPTTGQVLLFGESPSVAMRPACPSPEPSFPPGTPIPQVVAPCMTSPSPSVGAWVWRGASWSPLSAGSAPADQGVVVGGFGALAADPTSGHLVDVRAGFAYACAGPASPAVAVPCPLVEAPSGISSSLPAPSLPKATANAAMATPVPVPVVPAPLPSAVPVPMPTNVPAPGRVTCCSGSVRTWTGAAWSNPRTFSNGPQVITSGIAGDPAQHEIVAVTSLGTWTWDGTSWKAQHPTTSPPAAEGGSLVYDGVSGKLLLFGGEPVAAFKSSNPASQSAATPVSDELWAWDGKTWTQLSGATASPAPSLPPAPTPTLVLPSNPLPGSSLPPGAPSPAPTATPCTPGAAPTPPPTQTPTPTPAQGSGSGSGSSCRPVLVPPTSG